MRYDHDEVLDIIFNHLSLDLHKLLIYFFFSTLASLSWLMMYLIWLCSGNYNKSFTIYHFPLT